MRTITAFGASILAAFAGSGFAADIVRCVAPNGAVTYQQMQCPETSREQVAGIASEYPAPNFSERERLLANEKEMYKRLEAQRDRDTQLLMAREARADAEARAREAEAAAAAMSQPYYVAWPARSVRPAPHPRVARPGSQAVWSGGNPLSPGFSR